MPKSNEAAFSATYSDFKLIKTRGVVSISFEIPVEQAQQALDALGGMPVAATEVWCAIARLNPRGGQSSTEPSSDRKAGDVLPNSGFDSRDRGQTPKPLAQSVGALCAVKSFRVFQSDRCGEVVSTEEEAAAFVRRYCGVKSRSEIIHGTPAGYLWRDLVGQYRAWLRSPEIAA